ncbi:hypothetical protein CHARACLAT_033625, partial [Characodon lateralis]|nr:hypothetical protein [Characodon lateralis]
PGCANLFKTALANSNFMFFRQSPCMQGIVKIARREKKERDQSLHLLTPQSRDPGGRVPFNKKRDKTHLLLLWAPNHSHPGPSLEERPQTSPCRELPVRATNIWERCGQISEPK